MTYKMDKLCVATCVQFRPRFLHSTGQAYKGGPSTGVFATLHRALTAAVKERRRPTTADRGGPR